MTINVATYRQDDGTYLLPASLDIDDCDLRDLELNRAVWSVGRSESGARLAALDSRFYGNPNFTCEWLR